MTVGTKEEDADGLHALRRPVVASHGALPFQIPMLAQQRREEKTDEQLLLAHRGVPVLSQVNDSARFSKRVDDRVQDHGRGSRVCRYRDFSACTQLVCMLVARAYLTMLGLVYYEHEIQCRG